MGIDLGPILETFAFVVSALGSSVAIVMNRSDPPYGVDLYKDTEEPPAPKEDAAAALAAGAKIHAPPLLDQFFALPGAERKKLLADLYKSTWDAFGKGDRDAERHLRDIVGHGLRPKMLSGPARAILTYHYALSQIITAENPYDLAGSAHSFTERVFERLAEMMASGPANFENAADLARKINIGPSGFINWLLRKRTRQWQRRWPADEMSVIFHDLRNDMQMVNMFGDETGLKSIWTEAEVKTLQSMLVLAKYSSSVIKHTHNALLAQILVAMNSGINIEIDIDHDLHYRAGLELSSVGKILINLVDNARRYHRSSNETGLFVKVVWDEQKQALIVEDNGTGIADTVKIWLKHEREAERHPDVAGTGLGLAIVEKLIKELGWRIELESEVDKGTRFIIYPKHGDIIKETRSGPGGSSGPGQEMPPSPENASPSLTTLAPAYSGYEITQAHYAITAAHDEDAYSIRAFSEEVESEGGEAIDTDADDYHALASGMLLFQCATQVPASTF